MTARELLLASRANHVCHYCREPLAVGLITVDHIVPRSLGGRNHTANLATCCASCNQLKGQRRWHPDCKRCKRAWRIWERRNRKARPSIAA